MESNLRDSVLSHFSVFENEVDVKSPIHKVRQEAMERFRKTNFPRKKDPFWEYTSLNDIVSKDYNLFPTKIEIDLGGLNPYFIEHLDSYRIVFINGFYTPDMSDCIRDMKVCICPLSEAMKEEDVSRYFNKAMPSSSLSDLNTAFVREGAYIHVKKGAMVDKPIQILFFSVSEEDTFTQPRNLLIVEEDSEVSIIEKHHNLGKGVVFTNSVTEGFVAKEALLNYYKIQNDVTSTSFVDNTFLMQEELSAVSVYTTSFGNSLLRNNLNISQNGSRSKTKLYGLTMIEDEQHVDHNTLIHHHSPNCESFEEYKTLVNDFATAIFNGRVVVDKDAQKLNAYQQNRNILIGEKSSVKAKPQLEIFADDVKCSHGCTIGQIDQEMLFYLRSRGIPKKQAEGVLMYAFANNILEEITIPEVRHIVQKLIAHKLSININFDA